LPTVGGTGKTLVGSPRVRVFDTTKRINDLLYTAMNLEKGAWRFYAAVARRHENEPFAETFEVPAQAEKAHIRALTRAIETCPD
jgi:sulfur-carrier protein adenylyltransferase/sulfurtransferase